MTSDRRHLEELITRYEFGARIEYLFFLSHVNRSHSAIDKSCLSQWFISPFTVDDVVYPTSEHWMMASKALLFGDADAYKNIINTTDARAVKALGKTIKYFDEDVWLTHRFDLVVRGNIHKFNQNKDLAEYLMTTSDKVLVEASPYDTIWGIGLAEDASDVNNLYCWKGLNLLGFALMEVRTFLHDFGHFELFKFPKLLPWIAFPGISPTDMFWRMGKGEDYFNEFHKAYDALSESRKMIFQKSTIVPLDWTNNFI